jgi:hypothetical protein
MGRWNRDAIERQLAHMEENDVRRAYMHAAEFWNERVEMMQVWADYLDSLRYGSSHDQDVRPFVRSQGCCQSDGLFAGQFMETANDRG